MSDLVKHILLKKKNANIKPDSLISRNNLIFHLNDYALQEAPFKEEDDPRIYDTIEQCILAIEQAPAVESVIDEKILMDNISNLEDYLFDKYCIEGDPEIEKILLKSLKEKNNELTDELIDMDF